MLDRDRILSFNFEFAIRGGREVPNHRFRQERDITEPAHGPFIDGKAFGPPEVAVDQRRIKLHGEPFVDAIADDELGDRAFQSLSGRIGDLVSVELQRAEMSELLSDCCVESAWRHFLLWHRIQLRRVTATQIACACGHRENDERKNE